MTAITSTFRRDANNVPIWTEGLVESKAITYVGASTGAIGTTTLFTVTGTVAVKIFGICGVNIAGAGSLEVGIAGNTAVLLAQIVNAEDLDVDEIYTDATPTSSVENMVTQNIISNGQNIIQTIGTTALTAGQITYYCIWSPLSSDANIVAA